MTSHFQTVFGGRIHYMSFGPADAAQTILCLHGNSSSGSAFETIAEGLVAHSSGLRVLCVDFPGHGRSDGGAFFKPYYSFQGLGDVVVGLIDALHIAPSGIIGHSMGGHIAIKAAPSIASLRQLVLISSPPIAGAEALGRFFRPDAPTGSIFAETLSETEMDDLAIAFATPDARREAIAAIRQDIARTDGLFRSELGASLSGASVTDELAIVKRLDHVDCYLIGGESDRFINPDYYSGILSALDLDESRRCVIPNTGHYPHLERPRETLDWIKQQILVAQAA